MNLNKFHNSETTFFSLFHLLNLTFVYSYGLHVNRIGQFWVTNQYIITFFFTLFSNFEFTSIMFKNIFCCSLFQVTPVTLISLPRYTSYYSCKLYFVPCFHTIFFAYFKFCNTYEKLCTQEFVLL